MSLLAVFLPFLSLILLVVALRLPLWLAGLAAFLLASLLWLLSPSIAPSDFLVPLMRALLVSCEIALILLGAISFLDFMQASGLTQRIKEALIHMTAGDPLLLAILLAWLFCAFIEGAAGFGAPAAIVAPLLLSLGFPPLTAAILPLIGDASAVPFGAVGTPVRIGFESLPMAGVPTLAAGFNLITGLVPVLAIYLLIPANSSESDYPRSSRLLFALLGSFCLTIPAFAFSFLGPELPSLLGALIGLMVFMIAMSLFHRRQRQKDKPAPHVSAADLGRLAQTFFPYILLSLGLLLGKIMLGPQKVYFEIQQNRIGVALFQPGLVFLVTMLGLKAFASPFRPLLLRRSVLIALKRLPPVFLAIFFMASLAQFMMAFLDTTTWLGASGTQVQIEWQFALIALAPFVGVMGAFVSGSATVANLLFAGLMTQLSTMVGTPIMLILSLHLLGAGAGNMIALQNLAAVQATVGLRRAERDMLAKLWRPCLAYAAVCSVIGLIYFSWELIRK